jgi:hypothetical protein
LSLRFIFCPLAYSRSSRRDWVELATTSFALIALRGRRCIGSKSPGLGRMADFRFFADRSTTKSPLTLCCSENWSKGATSSGAGQGRTVGDWFGACRQEPAVRQVSSPEAQTVLDAMLQNFIPVILEPGSESITPSLGAAWVDVTVPGWSDLEILQNYAAPFGHELRSDNVNNYPAGELVDRIREYAMPCGNQPDPLPPRVVTCWLLRRPFGASGEGVGKHESSRTCLASVASNHSQYPTTNGGRFSPSQRHHLACGKTCE